VRSLYFTLDQRDNAEWGFANKLTAPELFFRKTNRLAEIGGPSVSQVAYIV